MKTFLLFFVFLVAAFSAAAEKLSYSALGFTIVAPANWSLLNPDELAKNQQAQELKGAKLRSFINDTSKTPFIDLRRSPDLNAVIRVNVRPLNVKDPTGMLRVMVGGFKTVSKDFEVVESAHKVTIAGLPSAKTIFTYRNELEDGSYRSVHTTSIMIAADGLLFVINANAKNPPSEEVSQDIQAAISSIAID